MSETPFDPNASYDDTASAFQVEGRSVRGRICRLGPRSIDAILQGDRFPTPVAIATGEAALIAALVGSAMKSSGRIIVQAQGDGPAPLIVSEYNSEGALRASAKVNPDAPDWSAQRGRVALSELIGSGSFAMTIDPGDSGRRYQGISPLEGDTFATATEHYFNQSEQTQTRLFLSVGRLTDAMGVESWRAGGMFLQHIAGDNARGDTGEDWNHVLTLAETVEDEELLDPGLESFQLLYRLFNEDGVRVFEPKPIHFACSCSRERLVSVVAAFPEEDRRDMIEEGNVEAVCDYCGTRYDILPNEIGL